MSARGRSLSAEAMPWCRLAPSALCTSRPVSAPNEARTAAARKCVVVVLPLVPDTMAIRRPCSSLARACGSRVSITLPWMDAPEPRRATREATEARRPAQVAAVNRARAVGEIDMAAINTSRTGWGE